MDQEIKNTSEEAEAEFAKLNPNNRETYVNNRIVDLLEVSNGAESDTASY